MRVSVLVQCGCVWAWLASCAAASAAAETSLDTALRRLQERYDGTRTMTADFRQTVESPTLAGTLESRGTVAFEKPNRMRWDYAAPDRQLIVGDGTTLWIYQPDDKQVIKAPLGEAFQARTPVSFLGGLGQIERDFAPSLEREDTRRWVLRLVPRTDQGIGTLTLTVRKEDASVEEARVTDPLGTSTRLELSAERRNVPLGAELFRFAPPPGVDVVRPPAF
jgi:outer membrane lipoprotein carrier protein